MIKNTLRADVYEANPRDYYDVWDTIDTKCHLIKRNRKKNTGNIIYTAKGLTYLISY
jgi:hypothetical protein